MYYHKHFQSVNFVIGKNMIVTKGVRSTTTALDFQSHTHSSQASLLVMDSHLRGLCDAHAEEYDRANISRNFPPERNQGSHRLQSISPRRSTSRELTAHALSGDTLQRAYSIVFGFHKTLMRLMATAPLTNTLRTGMC